MNIAIVILNWNGKSLLERFLPSVVAHSPNADIYIADNASTDTSIAFIEEHYKEVRVLKNTENGFYAKGYNDDLKHIITDIYVLLNSDVQVTPGWLEPMVELFDNPSIGAAQPKIKDLNKPTHFEYAGAAGGYLDAFGYPFCRGRIFDTCEEDKGQYNDTVEVQWASGACLFVRATSYWQAGALDETFFAHQEEIDLCWRLRNMGYKIVASGASEVLHQGGATLPLENPKKTFYNFRNSLFNVMKNVKGIKAFFIVFSRLVLDGIAGLKYLFNGESGHLVAIVKAHLSFYSHLPTLLVNRMTLKYKTPYAKTFSIVFKYFILKKRYFKDLK